MRKGSMPAFALAAAMALSLTWSVNGASEDTLPALTLRNSYGTLVFSEEEYRYCYETVLEQVMRSAGEYLSFLKLDPEKPLSEQECPISQDDISWEEYLISQTTDMLTDMGAVALESGWNAGTGEDVPEEETSAQEAIGEEYQTEQKTIGEECRTEQKTAEEENQAEKPGQRIASLYEAMQTRLSQVRAEASFSEEDLEDYFREHLHEFRGVTYLLAYVDGAGYGGSSAKAIVEQLEQAENAGVFERLTLELTGAGVSRIENIREPEMGNPEAQDVQWLLSDERSPGDVYTGQTGGNYFVLYYLTQDDQGFGVDAEGPWKTQVENAMRDAACARYLSQLRSDIQLEIGPGLAPAVKQK